MVTYKEYKILRKVKCAAFLNGIFNDITQTNVFSPLIIKKNKVSFYYKKGPMSFV